MGQKVNRQLPTVNKNWALVGLQPIKRVDVRQDHEIRELIEKKCRNYQSRWIDA